MEVWLRQCSRQHKGRTMMILLDKPGPKVEPPVRIHVEYGQEARDLEKLKKEISGINSSSGHMWNSSPKKHSPAMS